MSTSPSPSSTRRSREECCCEWQGCSFIATDPEQLYVHLCNDHIGRKSTNNLCLSCKWKGCNTTCAKRDHITSHLRVHTPLKPHICEICNKTFKRPQDLKKHEKIHTEEHHAQHKHSKAITISDPAFSVKTHPGTAPATHDYSTSDDYRQRHPHMENGYYHETRRGVGTHSSLVEHEALTHSTVPNGALGNDYSSNRHSRSNLSGEDHYPRGGAKRSHDTVVMEDFLHDMKRRKYAPTYDAPMVERLSALSNLSQLFQAQAQAQQGAFAENAIGSNGISNQMPLNGFDSAQPPAFDPGAIPSNLEELALVNAFLVRLSEQISASANIANANNTLPSVNGQQPPNGIGNPMNTPAGFGPYGAGLGMPMGHMGGFNLLSHMGGLGTLGLGAYPRLAGMNGLMGFANGLEALGGLGMLSPAAYQSALAAAAATAAMGQHGYHANGGVVPNPYMDLSSIAALAGIQGFGREGPQSAQNDVIAGPDFNPSQVMSNPSPPLLLPRPIPSMQQVQHTQLNPFGLQSGLSQSYSHADVHTLPSFDSDRHSSSRLRVGTDSSTSPAKRASMSVGQDHSKRSRWSSSTHLSQTFSGSTSSRSSTSSPSASVSDQALPSPEPFNDMQTKGGADSIDFGVSFDPPFGTNHLAPNSGVPTLPDYDLDAILGENRDPRGRMAAATLNQHVPKLGMMEVTGSMPILREVPKLQSPHPAYRSSSSLVGSEEEVMNVDEEESVPAVIGRVHPVEPRTLASGPSAFLPGCPRHRGATSSIYPPRGYSDSSLKLPAIRRRAPSISSHSTSSSKDTDETGPSYEGDENHCSDDPSSPCTPRFEVKTPTAPGKVVLPGVRSILDPINTARQRPIDRLASDINRINIASRPSTSSSTTSTTASTGLSALQEEKSNHLSLIRRFFILINEEFARRHRGLVTANIQAVQKAYERQRASPVPSLRRLEQRTPTASSGGAARSGYPVIGYDSDEDIAMQGSSDESIRADSNEDVDQLEEDSDEEEFSHSAHGTVDSSKLPLPILRPVRV